MDIQVCEGGIIEPVKAGTNLFYTITPTNNGPDAAPDVKVIDTLPAGVTFQSATATQGSYVSGTGVWSVGDLPVEAVDLITNGGFETGDFTGWTVVTTADPGTTELTPYAVASGGSGWFGKLTFIIQRQGSRRT